MKKDLDKARDIYGLFILLVTKVFKTRLSFVGLKSNKKLWVMEKNEVAGFIFSQ